MIKIKFELNDKDGLRIKREKKMELESNEERKKTIKMELELNFCYWCPFQGLLPVWSLLPRPSGQLT